MCLSCVGTLTCGFFLINMLKNILEIFNNLKEKCFSLAQFIVKIQYITCIAYKIYVTLLFRLSLKLPVYSKLLVTEFWESQKLYVNF